MMEGLWFRCDDRDEVMAMEKRGLWIGDEEEHV